MFDVALPIFQAPMAGGPDTPALAAAVSNAGGLGSLGCAYLTPAQIEDAAREVRARTSRPFALNLFVRAGDDEVRPVAARVRATLDAFRAELGLSPLAEEAGRGESPRYEEQLEAVMRVAPRVVSFTFGAPSAAQVDALHARGIAVMGTATTAEEAVVLDDLGVDAICAQGAEAGGHRGTFRGSFDDALIGTLPLVQHILAVTHRPVVAAGGLMTGAAIRAVLDLGASAAQLGTAFLCCDEAGTSPAYREALRTATATTITRAFSGRPGRGVRNQMTDVFLAIPAEPFPVQQRLTAELRREATRQGRTDLMQLWAGQGAPLVRAMPAAALVETLAREAGLVAA